MANNIEMTLLGTGSSVPTAKRNHPGILLEYKAEAMLFDCGEGIQRQFRKAKKNPMRLTKLFISHWHADHILGIPGLLNTLQLNGYDKTLEIYGPRGTKKFMNLIMKIFIQREKIKLKINEVSSGKVFENDDFIVEALPMKHGTPSLAYNFTIKDCFRIDKKKLAKLKISHKDVKKLQLLKKGKDVTINGKKVKHKDLTYCQEGKKVSLIFDTGVNENIAKISKNADLMICESTYLDEKSLANERFHMVVEDVTKLAKKAKAKKLVLIHISQKHQMKDKEIMKEAKKYFSNVVIGEDLMSFKI